MSNAISVIVIIIYGETLTSDFTLISLMWFIITHYRSNYLSYLKNTIIYWALLLLDYIKKVTHTIIK